jgi:hypothetical protein
VLRQHQVIRKPNPRALLPKTEDGTEALVIDLVENNREVESWSCDDVIKWIQVSCPVITNELP